MRRTARIPLFICLTAISLGTAPGLGAITPPYTIEGMVWRSSEQRGGFYEIAFRRGGRFQLARFTGKSTRNFEGRYRYKRGRAILTPAVGRKTSLSCVHQVNKAAGMRMYWSCDLPAGGERDFHHAKVGRALKIQGHGAETMRLRIFRVRAARAWVRDKVGGRSLARLFRGRYVTALAKTSRRGTTWYFVVLKKRTGGMLQGWVRARFLRAAK